MQEKKGEGVGGHEGRKTEPQTNWRLQIIWILVCWTTAESQQSARVVS